jgi:uncharacterized protein YndB with AHSA1/START domain
MSFIIERTLEIDAPAAVVWEVLTDFARYPEWNPFVLECRSTLKPGEAFDMRVKLMSRPQRQVEWVLEHVPGQRFAYQMKPFPLGALRSRRSHEVEPLGEQRTRYRSYFRLEGWLMPLVRALMGRRIEVGMQGMWEGVQARAEKLWAQRRGSKAA